MLILEHMWKKVQGVSKKWLLISLLNIWCWKLKLNGWKVRWYFARLLMVRQGADGSFPITFTLTVKIDRVQYIYMCMYICICMCLHVRWRERCSMDILCMYIYFDSQNWTCSIYIHVCACMYIGERCIMDILDHQDQGQKEVHLNLCLFQTKILWANMLMDN